MTPIFQMPGLRVFISYCHDDRDLFLKLKQVLTDDFHCHVLSDHDIRGGQPFTDTIKGLISHAHVFLPLITEKAKERPWVHQETGFAMALNIPIYTVVLKNTGMLQEMTAQLQAVDVSRENFAEDVKAKLAANPLSSLLRPRLSGHQEMVRVADWPEQRSEWLADAGQRIMDLGQFGCVRQIGAFSSFCIPDVPLDHEKWETRDGHITRSQYSRHCLRRERQILERHARQAGCKLIIYPSLDLHQQGKVAHTTRLIELRDFLQEFPDRNLNNPDVPLLQILIAPRLSDGSVVMIGDWFVSESVAPRTTGYRQTIINWHAPTAHQWVNRFDQQFEELRRETKVKSPDGRAEAILEIDRLIALNGSSTV